MFVDNIKENKNRIKSINHLVEIPSLYDAIYSDVFSYSRREEIIKEKVGQGSSVMVLGCGSGLLIDRLDNYDVLGIDKNEHMLELCRKRNNCTTLNHDIVDKIPVSSEFDMCTMLGNVCAVFSINQLDRLLDNVKKNVGTYLLFDFISSHKDIKDRSTEIYLDDIFINVDSNHTFNGETVDFQILYEVNINGQTESFEESFSMNVHNKREVSDLVEEHGFEVQEIKDYERKLFCCKL